MQRLHAETFRGSVVSSPRRGHPERNGWKRSAPQRSAGRKLITHGLLHNSITKVWSSPSAGETCDGCDLILAKEDLLMAGTTLTRDRMPLHFHVVCFRVWDDQRRALQS